MNALTHFNFNDHKLRVVTINDSPWFVAADLCKILDVYMSGDKAIVSNIGSFILPDEKCKARIPVSEKEKTFTTSRSTVDASLLSESGLYKLIMRSNKPQARPFQDWVTRTVLPAIRKDGMYVMGEEKVVAGEMSEDELILKAMSLMSKKVERLTEEKAVLQLTNTKQAALIDSEINHMTVQKYYANQDIYPTMSQAITLGKRATAISEFLGLSIEKRHAIKQDDGRLTIRNEYHTAALDKAFKEMVKEGRFYL